MTVRREQVTVSLIGLLSDVYGGKVSPLSWVSHYAGSQEKVLQLLTCLQKGYPIGSFMLGQPARDVDFHLLTKKRLGPVPRADDASYPSVVLKGQGRLSMLAWILSGATEVPSDLTSEEAQVWAGNRLMYSLEEDAFSFHPHDADLNSRYLPARSVFDAKSTNVIMRNLWRTEEWGKFPEDVKEGWAKNLADTQDAIRSLAVQVVTLQGLTVDELEEAYLLMSKLDCSA